VIDRRDYPTLFGTTEVSWGPIDVRFSLLTGEIEPALVARIYIVPFIGDACVVVGFDTDGGDWGPAGGGLEPGETFQMALERELREEAGARLRTYTAFGVLRCRARSAPYRPHLPHPDCDCCMAMAISNWSVRPKSQRMGRASSRLQVMGPEQATAFLAGNGRPWEADLYRLADRLRRDPSAPGNC